MKPVAEVRPLGAPHFAAASVVCLLQLVASAWRIEIQPIMSPYPMYSNVYASTEQFDALNGMKPILAFHYVDETGHATDISADLESLQLDAILRDASVSLSRREALSPESRALVEGARVTYARERGRPLDRLLVRISQEAFDWNEGRFYWKLRDAELGTLDLATVTFQPAAVSN